MPFFSVRAWSAPALAGRAVLTAVLAASLVVTAADPPPDRRQQIREQIEAGEFGPALDAAHEIEDLAERVRQFHQIAAAQRIAKDFRGAQETARRIPERSTRGKARAEVARDRGQTGGGNQADFTELIELITNTVNPEGWEDTGGPGTVREYNTGVYVDPQGLMRQWTRQEQSGRLEALSRRARAAQLNDDLSRPSSLRFVSLRRLERAVAARLDAGQPLPETLRRLAGLVAIKYLVVDDEEHDLLVGGPAEPWKYDDAGRAVGSESSRPILELDDLVVVLRSFAPGGDALFGCSINTRDANLKSVKEFVDSSNRAGALRPGQLGRWLKELEARLGVQDVVVHGVPAETRVAQVMVEADYKMKLIGVAKLDGGPNIPSYFDLLRRAGQVRGAPLEALRWWLTMKYDAIVHSPDRRVFELAGSSVLVQSENQFVNAHGQHVPTGVAEPVNRQFAENFTNHYSALAARDPVFAHLRNIFDMALVAALCRQERLLTAIGWDLGTFAPAGAYEPARVTAPRVVDSVINHRVYGGKDIVVQVAGGVQANLRETVDNAALRRESPDLPRASRKMSVPAARWWWDTSSDE